MPASLTTLPYEVLSYVVDGLNFIDIVNLARTCKRLQFLERQDKICRKHLEATLPFSSELIRARDSNGSFASAFRGAAKRKKAIATATPYSVAIVGFGDDYTYSNGVLCYVLDDTLRILGVHKSAYKETVVHVPGLLRKFLIDTEQRIGRFRILYYDDGIVSCLYTLPEPEPKSYLIVINIYKGRLLLAYMLDCADKIFARHNSKFLYYGVYIGNSWDHRKKWVLQGYRFEEQEWFEQRIHLQELIGADIGSTICFEIHDGYFYALSNQTTFEVEEVDWTSFYHCVRFPVDSPFRCLLQKTGLDKHMWRRQHREGPLDDRWGSLSLKVDEATGELNIVETRKEFRAGARTSQRSYYTTKIVFPERLMEERVYFSAPIPSSSLSSSELSVNCPLALIHATQLAISGSISTVHEKQELAALTNDRLALTLTPSDNPHWLTPQTRLPRNVHSGDDGLLVFFQTPLRYYNLSASTFLDLIDDRPLSSSQNAQRLRLRVGSRKLDPPAMDENNVLVRHPDPQTGEVTEGLGETYTALPVAFWPPEQGPCERFDKELDNIYKLLNPPTHIGNVEGTADERSLIYLTGSKDMPRAIVLVNFDPAIKLQGLQKYRGGRGSSIGMRTMYDKERLGGVSAWGGEHERFVVEDRGLPKGKGKGKEKEDEGAPLSSQLPILEGTDGSSLDRRWVWTEPAMYMAIDRGYDFSF